MVATVESILGNSLPDSPQTYAPGTRPAKSHTQACKAKTWCALKFKWVPVLAFYAAAPSTRKSLERSGDTFKSHG